MEKREILGNYIKRLEKAIARELSVRKEIENDKATLKYLQEQKDSGVAFENPVYEDYEAWIVNVQKQIKKGENTLENIAFKKYEVEAVKFYLEKNAE